MRKLFLVLTLLAFSLGCSVQNSQTQKEYPGSDQSAHNEKSTNTETKPNTPASQDLNQKDDHTKNITNPAEHNPNPESNVESMSQGNNKDPRTHGTTKGQNPDKKKQ
jgi:hypothetical protein